MTNEEAVKRLDEAMALIESVRDSLEDDIPPTQNVIPIPPGVSVQSIIDTLPDADDVVLTLQAGATYSGNVIFRVRTGPTILTTAGFAVADGVRVTPADVPTMATLLPVDGTLPTIGFDFGAHDVTILGVDIPGNPIHPDHTTIAVGLHPKTWANPASIADLPTRIRFDRIHMDAESTGGRQAIRADGIDIKVVESHISGFWISGQDSQAIGIINGAGPLLVANNHLEGSGENFMAGGSDPSIPNLIPSDLTFLDNTFFKPQSWRNKPGTVKNLFELKSAQRVTIRRNVFDGVWKDAQAGSAIVFTVRNQGGGAPWSQVKDVLFEDNVIRNVENFAFNLLGVDNLHPSQITKNIIIRNNLILDAGSAALIQSQFEVLEFRHNTFVKLNPSSGKILGMTSSVIGFVFCDSVTPSGAYGITGDGTTGVGTPSLEANVQAPYVFTKSLIEKSAARTIPYPVGNYLITANTLASKLNAQYAVTDPVLVGTDGRIVGIDPSKLPQY